MNLSQANALVEQALSSHQSERFADAEELWEDEPVLDTIPVDEGDEEWVW
jgi:hypothetical protein